MRTLSLWLLLLATSFSLALAQENSPEAVYRYVKYIQVKGAQFSQQEAIIRLSGLQSGWMRMPSPQISDAMKRIWREKVFADVKIQADALEGDSVRLIIEVEESLRLASYRISGTNKQQEKELKETLHLNLGAYFTDAQALSIKRMVRNYFVEKGYYHSQVDLDIQTDPQLKGRLKVNIQIEKGQRTRIREIVVADKGLMSKREHQKALKPLSQYSWWKVWQRSRLLPKEYEEARKQLLRAYQAKAYLDARLLSDTIETLPDGHLRVAFRVESGKPYYLRNIRWVGNELYESSLLNAVLDMKKGDLYERDKLETHLYAHPEGYDVSTLYLDRGYLFFKLDPVISAVGEDSVDLQIRIQEGVPAYIRDVSVVGNTRTAEHVILRELDTQPGDLFSRSAIIRSQRKLMGLNYFDPEGFNVVPKPDPQTGAVDLEYVVEDKSTDQFQFRGSWAPKLYDDNDNLISGGLTGTLMLVLNNFSSKRLLQKDAWKPVPTGDGQQLSLAIQSNGQSYTNFGASFQEPWLGGKKPRFFGWSTNYVLYNTLNNSEAGTDEFKSRSFSASLDFGSRLTFPDDFTRYYVSLGYRYYDLENPGSLYPVFEGTDRAFVNIISMDQELRRSNLDHPMFPSSGSDFSFKLSLTPPYSLFQSGGQAAEASPAETYKLLEYHKWQLKGDMYNDLGRGLVLRLHGEAGYVGSYGEGEISPFERYSLGGYGINAAANGGFMGVDLVPLRGYAPQAMDNEDANYPLYQRYYAELRYKIPLPQSYPLWLLGFAEVGNGYENFRDFDPLRLKRSAGLGFRTNIPMIGMFGIDWGYGFDKVNESDDKVSGHQFHLILGREF